MTQKLVLIRGLPGSGKSTLAMNMVLGKPNWSWCETDMFFSQPDGSYDTFLFGPSSAVPYLRLSVWTTRDSMPVPKRDSFRQRV